MYCETIFNLLSLFTQQTLKRRLLIAHSCLNGHKIYILTLIQLRLARRMMETFSYRRSCTE